MKRRTILTGIGATGLVLGGTALIAPWQSGRNPALPPLGAAGAQATGDMPEIVDMALGQEDAPVTVIEYASFTCPHCATFHENVFPQIKENYIETGKVRFVYREVYFDRFGLWATMVARCAGPERYFAVVDRIYETQREWVQGEPATVAENLRRIGRSVGLGEAELEACLTDADMAQALVDRYETHQEEHNIPGTPTFIIDGEQFSNMSYASFAEILDERVAAAQ
ncbi:MULTISPECIES: DsbA family protein [Paracoccaceae]|jgi:protein-disulfide isomerase|uniref:DsbA family protein n=1 Tax=Rhodobacterales TaxID=204455 RepID=UPI001B09286F|nr:DsbA family protein [Boseongicola sp. H5]MBO6603736.1 DsbA family protein [Roseicyclus sp.]MBO6623383.1 DsbA family protein [Roseicyclus sp.]MBO6920719.1 DsbA family protein [Roseicyclus sp.]